jgi:hypothetical protein
MKRLPEWVCGVPQRLDWAGLLTEMRFPNPESL